MTIPYPPNWLLWLVVVLTAGEVLLFLGKLLYTVIKAYLWRRKNVVRER